MYLQRMLAVFALAVSAAVFSGCPCDPPVRGELTPFSGRFGYFVEGPWGFEGALTKENLGDAAWILEGTFQFPTSGYIVFPTKVLVLESYPEQVHITFQVMPPSPNQMVLQVITEVSIAPVTIAASDEATFDVRFQTLCFIPPESN